MSTESEILAVARDWETMNIQDDIYGVPFPHHCDYWHLGKRLAHEVIRLTSRVKALEQDLKSAFSSDYNANPHNPIDCA